MARELPWVTVVANAGFLCACNSLVGFRETLFDFRPNTAATCTSKKKSKTWEYKVKDNIIMAMQK